MTYYFEIKNTRTNEIHQGYGSNMKAIATQANWKAKDCKCIYRAPAL